MNFYKKISLILIIQLILQLCCLTYCMATEEQFINVDNELINQENINIVEEQNEGMRIYSESAILIEAKTGKVLYDKDMYDRKYPASTTKILTAIIALEMCDLNERAIASHEAVNSIKSGYTTANIQENESFTVEELVKVMLVLSANEAANVIAEHISGSVSEFANLMNEKAKQIGCLDSNFLNANGAHEDNHYSTAYDLAMITKYCMKNDKFKEIIMLKECELPATEIWTEHSRIFKNTNSLLNPESKYYYPYCIGGKTGFTTPAKNCLISVSNKDDFELISVVLHAETTEEYLSARYMDTINLFEYGYNNYTKDEILEEYDMINQEAERDNENKLASFIAGFFTSDNIDDNDQKNSLNQDKEFIQELNNESEKKTVFDKNTVISKDISMIILGATIIVLMGMHYAIKAIIRKRFDLRVRNTQDIYNFKLN